MTRFNLRTNVVSMMTNSETPRSVSDRRIAYLKKMGEDKRNTVAWRDAVHEQAMLNFHGIGPACDKK